MAESIRILRAVSDLESDSDAYARLIERLTNITFVVAGILAVALCVSLILNAKTEASVTQARVEQRVPYIPPKPNFK